jgi:catechol 2,3-dioxygenase-like lactoylglutathione lyase family enzyme
MPDFELPPQNAASPFADMRGHHVAIRATSLEQAKDFYVGKLDFRVVAEWDYADERLAYLALPADDNLFVEILGGGRLYPLKCGPIRTSATV